MARIIHTPADEIELEGVIRLNGVPIVLGIDVLDEGVFVATRKRVNFTGSGVSVADNPAQDRVDVTITTGSAGATIVPIFTGIHTTGSGTFVVVAGWVMDMDKVAGSLQLRWNQSVVPLGSAEVRVFDVTGSSPLGSLLVSSTGLKVFPVVNPGGVRLLRLEHRVASGTGNSEIEGAVLEG
jgi:hypothetical protein